MNPTQMNPNQNTKLITNYWICSRFWIGCSIKSRLLESVWLLVCLKVNVWGFNFRWPVGFGLFAEIIMTQNGILLNFQKENRIQRFIHSRINMSVRFLRIRILVNIIGEWIIWYKMYAFKNLSNCKIHTKGFISIEIKY